MMPGPEDAADGEMSSCGTNSNQSQDRDKARKLENKVKQLEAQMQDFLKIFSGVVKNGSVEWGEKIEIPKEELDGLLSSEGTTTRDTMSSANESFEPQSREANATPQCDNGNNVDEEIGGMPLEWQAAQYMYHDRSSYSLEEEKLEEGGGSDLVDEVGPRGATENHRVTITKTQSMGATEGLLGGGASSNDGHLSDPESDEEKCPIPKRDHFVTLFDKESNTSYSFQDSVYLQLMTEQAGSAGLIVPLLLMGIGVASLVLVIITAYDGTNGDNPLNIPSNHESSHVLIAQVLGKNYDTNILC